MRGLPIGIQTFKKIREGNLVYVDKTEFVFKLAQPEGSYFLSRPRRFGKSMLLETFRELFMGSEALFRGLWIHDKWDWSQTFPVVHFSFDKMNYEGIGLDNAISSELKLCAERYEIELVEQAFKSQFKELIEKLYQKKGKIVLLIDEYDKPIVDFLEQAKLPQALANQKIMKSFYSVLKGSEAYLRFFFVTGVSKFSKVSLFSDLNHVNDLTLNKHFATMLGYTQQELEFYFADYLKNVQNSLEISRDDLLERMRIWYDGFSWDGKTHVYNPFGTLNFLEKEAFRNYWFTTGMPTFLLKTMRERQIFNVGRTVISGERLENYTLENLDLVPLLFQTGYLTVKSMERLSDEMVLDFPNKEVQESLFRFMIDGLSSLDYRSDAGISNKDLLAAFQAADLDRVKELLNALLAGLPSEAYQKTAEGLYHGLIHFIFQLLGMYIKSEVHSSKGRADSVVETATHVFIFEFKFNKTAEDALTQIKNKKYADKYRAAKKTIIGIGVNFNSNDREIDDWETEVL